MMVRNMFMFKFKKPNIMIVTGRLKFSNIIFKLFLHALSASSQFRLQISCKKAPEFISIDDPESHNIHSRNASVVAIINKVEVFELKP